MCEASSTVGGQSSVGKKQVESANLYKVAAFSPSGLLRSSTSRTLTQISGSLGTAQADDQR